MRKFFAILTVVGFFGIAVFGVFAMNHGHNEAGCIAASAQGATCPGTEDTLSFIAFHASAFKNFSTATFATVILLLIAVFVSNTGGLAIIPRHSDKQRPNLVVPLLKQRLTYWLSLHENSPSF